LDGSSPQTFVAKVVDFSLKSASANPLPQKDFDITSYFPVRPQGTWVHDVRYRPERVVLFHTGYGSFQDQLGKAKPDIRPAAVASSSKSVYAGMALAVIVSVVSIGIWIRRKQSV
jgi:hypothetical protein